MKKAKSERNEAFSARGKISGGRLIAVHAALCALVLLFVVFPVRFGPLSLAIIPIIATIVSAEVLGVPNGMLTGLFFGIVSLVGQLVSPGVLSFAFYNPLVSILPRILIGPAAFGTAKLLKKISDKIPTPIANSAGALAGVAVNTFGVLGMILALYHGRSLARAGSAINIPWFTAILLTNSLPEAVFCAILAPPISAAVKKIFPAD